MLNVTELENRQKRYRKKIILPRIFFASIILLISSTLVYFILPNKDIIDTPKQVQIIASTMDIKTPKIIKQDVDVKVITNVLKTEALEDVENSLNEKKVIVYPYLNFMPEIRVESVNNEIQKIDNVAVDIQNYVDVVEKETTVQIESSDSEFNSVMEKEVNYKNKDIKFQKHSTNKDIEHVLKRFEQNNNPTLSLFAAKKYYELGQYDKAYNYALITNNINSEIDDSWIVFTKSLVKLKHRDKAIDILKNYIKQSHSAEAKILLNDIISRKFND